MIVIEHNLDDIKKADWIIDMVLKAVRAADVLYQKVHLSKSLKHPTVILHSLFKRMQAV